ncbi:hypothetical protein [Herbaspirillum sp. RV1423]|uniref:hypothetical protein n=1 Tax=Herbaspirillum sp. RV1423 TaxID=1443993 RepID=UPI000688988A|nr:hypothetical protein [Herbaspirillum sp. RV1423]
MPSCTTATQDTSLPATPQANAKPDAAQRIMKLEKAVNFMDALSQEGFGQIAAIAKLAILSLETPEGYYPAHRETLAAAFTAICKIADDIADCINCEAEEVGLNHKDERTEARHEARREGERQYAQLADTATDDEVTT